MTYDAVLLAGGRIRGPFAQETGVRYKALISIGGLNLLERTVRAVRTTANARRILVVGPAELQDAATAAGADGFVVEGASIPENLERGIHTLNQLEDAATQRVLASATDLPFITAEAVTAFVHNCPACADICVPVLRRRSFEMRFPGAPARFVRLRDGEYTTGCVFLLNPEVVLAGRPHIQKICNARKNQAAMAMLLGPLFMARFVTRRLRVEHIERRCGQILGKEGAAVLDSPPELAFDIDDLEDYRYAASTQGHSCV
ncbi:MAG: molybdenum cofactor guanylyltransferase [Chthonomonadales bacterium]